VGRSWAVFVVLTLLVTAWVIAPLWAVQRPPIQDLPQHVAAIRVIGDFGTTELRFQEYFELSIFRTQYVSVYLLAWLLSLVTSPLIAAKLVLSLGLVTTPLCLGWLLRSLRAHPLLAWVSLPVLVNVHVLLGFINFVVAIPLMLAGLGLCVEGVRRHSLRPFVGVGVVGFLAFYTHVIPFGLLCLGGLLIVVGGSWRDRLHGALALVPAGLASLLWLATSPSGKEVSRLWSNHAPKASPAIYAAPKEALAEWTDWLGGVLTGEADEHRTVLWIALLVVSVVCAALSNTHAKEAPDQATTWGRRALAALVVVCIAGYFLLPTSFSFMWPISRRFALLAVLLVIPAIGAASASVRFVAVAGSLFLAFSGARDQTEAFRRFEARSYQGLDQLLARIDQGRRVAGLIFGTNVPEVRFSPLLHAVGWVQAARGGAVMFTFAEFPQSPFVWRPGHRPPAVPPRWEWTPDRVEPDRDLLWYDYVLVHAGPGRIARACQFALDQRAGQWSLYRRTPPRPGCYSGAEPSN
jgi:hypothetical protein